MTLTGNLPGTPLQQALGLIVVALISGIGGILFAILMGGIELKVGKVGPIKIKPILTKVAIPPLVGMIVFGCLARNFLCSGTWTYTQKNTLEKFALYVSPLFCFEVACPLTLPVRDLKWFFFVLALSS